MSDNKTIKLNLKIKKMSKKFKFSIQGTEFQLPLSQVQQDSYNNNEKYIYMNAKSAASIIKQFVKQNYPELKVWATSDVYSGGSSVRVNISESDGSPVDSIIFDDIQKWEYMLKGGSFNGMIDMYEMREDSPCTDNGTPMKYFPSYIFIENKPNWGTKHYWMAEWNKWLQITDLDYTPTDNEKVWIENVVQKYGGWLGYNKQYMSKSVLKNIDSIMGCN